jgi:hypothetical protein
MVTIDDERESRKVDRVTISSVEPGAVAIDRISVLTPLVSNFYALVGDK